MGYAYSTGDLDDRDEPGQEAHAVLWRGRQVVDLTANTGAVAGKAGDINAHGQVVGNQRFPRARHDERACLWENGRMRVLELLPGGRAAWANAINEEGVVAGAASDTHHVWAVVWERGKIRRLPAPGHPNEARDINDRGDVVGAYRRGREPDAPMRAALWRNDTLYDLNDLAAADGWELKRAEAINDSGAIVGTGQRDGKPRSFLLIPQP